MPADPAQAERVLQAALRLLRLVEPAAVVDIIVLLHARAVLASNLACVEEIWGECPAASVPDRDLDINLQYVRRAANELRDRLRRELAAMEAGDAK